MKIAFIAWNSFQVLHFRPLLKALPNALLIIERRKRSIPISKQILKDLPNNIAHIDQGNIQKKVDGFFDILVTQTLFEQLYLFRKTKVAMLQYGYAKEPYNFGTWRALADLNLVYGEYAKNKIAYCSPTEVVGCPKYDFWHQESFHSQAKQKYTSVLSPTKKTILYAPSWGDLSSFSHYIDSFNKLSTDYNILIKIHHNSILLMDKDKNTIHAKHQPNIHFYGEDEDILALIAVSDLVISDFSGAIFDAIYCKKPVVLVSMPNMNHPKLDQFSIEIAQRENLGYVVETPEQLPSAVDLAISEQKRINSTLYDQLFSKTRCATELVIECLHKLNSNGYELPQSQLYIRQTVAELCEERMKQKKPKKFKGLNKKLFKKWKA